MLDARAIETFEPQLIDAVMAETGRARQHHVRRRDARKHAASAACRRTTKSSAATPPNAAGCRAASEIERGRPVGASRLGHGRQAVQGPQPGRSTIQVNGVHFSVLGVNEKKGSVFGNSQDEFVDDAARRVSAAVRLAPLARAHREAGATRAASSRRWTRRASRCACSATCGRETTTTSACSRRTRCWASGQTFSQGVFAILIGVVSLSLVVGGVVIMNIMLMVVSASARARSACARRSAPSGATSSGRS